ncbi:MAG: hypothetical protein PHV18_04315 [Lachnospiraceae bacterium]|nr:hypothetical protein [Lachnospiraceae bacterium]
MSVQISLDQDHYGKILRALRNIERSDESVLRTGVNNTAKIIQKDLASKVAKRYTGGAGKRATVLGTSKITKATTANPAAILTFSSPVRDVMEYKARIGRRAVSVAVLNTGLKKLNGAFAAGLRWQARSGESGVHDAIMQRVPGTVARKYAGKPAKPHYNKIRKVLSPSVAKQVGNPEVFNENEIADTLRNEVDKVVSKVLGG